MADQDVNTSNHLTKNNPPITTSTNNKELKEYIKDVSQQVLKRNYKLYKALENK